MWTNRFWELDFHNQALPYFSSIFPTLQNPEYWWAGYYWCAGCSICGLTRPALCLTPSTLLPCQCNAWYWYWYCAMSGTGTQLLHWSELLQCLCRSSCFESAPAPASKLSKLCWCSRRIASGQTRNVPLFSIVLQMAISHAKDLLENWNMDKNHSVDSVEKPA